MPLATADSRAPISQRDVTDRSPEAFVGNMNLPVHRWFRYSAGFSATWAEAAIQARTLKPGAKVLDPFAGSGTTLLAAEQQGVDAVGLETHPLVARIARAKLNWNQDPDVLEERGDQALRRAKPQVWRNPPQLLERIYPGPALAKLLGIRESIAHLRRDDPIDELLWLALLAILRKCSPAGTAQWQYVLPNKSKARTAEPFEAFRGQIRLMATDMRTVAQGGVRTKLLQSDARVMREIPDDSIDLVVTSPPYPNNFDYADATRIEMTFMGEIEKWGDLQDAVRSLLIRSCSQHMARYDAAEALDADELEPVRDELLEVYNRLMNERKLHGGRKAYHLMVAAYFHDLARTLISLRRVCRPGSTSQFVVGDSAPYAVHVPVERWLGELALNAGFESWHFEKIRDRNIKWKNRKHRVPLQEGILTIRG